MYGPTTTYYGVSSYDSVVKLNTVTSLMCSFTPNNLYGKNYETTTELKKYRTSDHRGEGLEEKEKAGRNIWDKWQKTEALLWPNHSLQLPLLRHHTCSAQRTVLARSTAKGDTGADTQPTELPTLPSQPDPLFSFSPPERHSLPLRGKPHPNIPLPALSHDDSPFRKQFLLVWNIMGLLPLRVFLESLSKISSAAQLCQKGKGKKKFLALFLQAPNGIFSKIGSIEKKC